MAVPVDYTKMSQDEILNEAAKHLTADKFIDWTKEVDKEAGIAQPVPPLLFSDRERIWSTFFQVHANLLATAELQAKLSSLLKKHSEFNPSEQDFPILNQHLDAALQFLVDAKDPVVQEGEPARRTSRGTSVVMNDPRPRSPRIQDETPSSQFDIHDNRTPDQVAADAWQPPRDEAGNLIKEPEVRAKRPMMPPPPVSSIPR